jgi:CDP-diacylglycerol--serine O-phosphatidyltransferase
MFLFNRENNFNLANLFTFVNISAGVLAIYFIIHKEFGYAVLLAWIGGLFDIFDGKIARKYNLSSEFGLQIDSFADSLSFVIVPQFLLYFAIFENSSIWQPLLAFTFIFYTVAGIRRLANFNLKSESGKVEKYFTGVPTPLGAILLWFSYLAWDFQLFQNPLYEVFYIILIGYLLNSKVKVKHL